MQSLTENDIRDALREVVDPELGINVVDLGLVYGITLDPDRVQVSLTMTSQACPMAPMLVDEARQAIEARLPEQVTATVELVWDPPWDPSRMSESARRELGWS